MFSDDEETSQSNPGVGSIPEEPENFKKLISRIRRNESIKDTQIKSGYVKYFKRVTQHFKWNDGVLRCQ